MFRRLGTALSRRSQSADAMREATAQTTVMLLEQNRKFEFWLRQKIEALEARVSAQEARLSLESKSENERWLTPEFSEAEDENPDWAVMPEDSIDDLDSSDEESVPDYLAMMTQPASHLADTQPLHPHHPHPATPDPYEPHDSQELYEPHQPNQLYEPHELQEPYEPSELIPPTSLTKLTEPHQLNELSQLTPPTLLTKLTELDEDEDWD